MMKSIVPETPGKSPNYWCTWARQNNVAEEKNAINFLGDQGAKNGRNNLNESLLFGQNGWADYYPLVRSDLFMLIDDGWDVPYGIHPDRNLPEFGSIVPDAGRFPSFPGSPAERLRGLNEALKARGWRGLGLWIAAQAQGESRDHVLTETERLEYWSDRLKWSNEAGIEFWKIDWGLHCRDLSFRRFLTELARELAPGMILEHSVGCICVNGLNFNAPDPRDIGSGRFIDMGEDVPRRAARLQQFSEMTRFYDLSGPLSTAAAMDRLAFFLTTAGSGWLNVEDELYMGAASGCCFGVMRSPENRPGITGEHVRCREADRAVRWQRIAPAFKSGDEPVNTSSRVLTDSWNYAVEDTWYSNLIGRVSRQTAPWGVARNMPLPQVGSLEPDGDLPFLVSSLHPNGAAAIVALPRVQAEKGFYRPMCRVELPFDCSDRIIGIFGTFAELVLPVRAEGVRIFGQDLAGDTARELTAELPVGNGSVTITEQVIQSLTIPADGDCSAPGIVIQIVSGK